MNHNKISKIKQTYHCRCSKFNFKEKNIWVTVHRLFRKLIAGLSDYQNRRYINKISFHNDLRIQINLPNHCENQFRIRIVFSDFDSALVETCTCERRKKIFTYVIHLRISQLFILGMSNITVNLDLQQCYTYIPSRGCCVSI